MVVSREAMIDMVRERFNGKQAKEDDYTTIRGDIITLGGNSKNQEDVCVISDTCIVECEELNVGAGTKFAKGVLIGDKLKKLKVAFEGGEEQTIECAKGIVDFYSFERIYVAELKGEAEPYVVITPLVKKPFKCEPTSAELNEIHNSLAGKIVGHKDELFSAIDYEELNNKLLR